MTSWDYLKLYLSLSDVKNNYDAGINLGFRENILL